MTTVGVEVEKKEHRSALRDGRGQILGKFLLSSNKNGINKLTHFALDYWIREAVVEINSESVDMDAKYIGRY